MEMFAKRRSGVGGLEESDLSSITEKELSECDKEKLHLLGNIQDGAGHVLLFSHSDGEIVAADMKIGQVPWIRIPGTPELDGVPSPSDRLEPPRKERRVEQGNESWGQGEGEVVPRTLLGHKLQECIPSKLYSSTQDAIETMKKAMSQRTFRFFNPDGSQNWAISLSSSKEDFSIICIEIEETEDFEGGGNFYNTLISLGRVMEFYADEKILKTACETVFKLLENYDRGMVYQFNDDLSGEVIYEIKKDHIDSNYMGMRFPSSDIPLTARQLFKKNGLRYIYSVNAEYNPIVDSGKCEIDLTNCRMRAVSKPHIVYLRNMGVTSSLAISIVVENELWGLLAFHGYTMPFKPSLHQRIACESIMSMVSVKVESIIRKTESSRVIELSDTLMKWEQSHSVAFNLLNNSDNLLKVFQADVICGLITDPLKDEVERIVLGDKSLAPTEDSFWERFASHPKRKIVSIHTREEVSAIGLTPVDSPASGFVYFQDNLLKIMIGRGLRVKDVRWAGNPDEPKLRIGGILSPRHSFETFMEKARKETRAWTSTDHHVITTFMDRICDHSHNRMATLLKNDIEEANIKYYNALARSEDNTLFFAQMSHELRTPFHGVMGCLNLMHDSFEAMSNEEIQDMINTALSTGNHMIGLLNDILNISKDKHVKKGLTLEPVSVKALAMNPIENLQTVAADKKITLDCNVNADHADRVVMTDKKKFMQIISNIVNNGIKFSEPGTIDIHVDLLDSMIQAVDKWGATATSYAGTVFTMTEDDLFDSVENARRNVLQLEGEDNRKWILASVADHGCGMKPGELAEMLKPYTQSSKGSNRAFQGTGLGLFICVSLCHQLDGFIACSSTPNVGSVFHVGIPVKMSDVDEMLVDDIPKEVIAS
ncbi:Phytochrome-like protein cph1 [Seminavis robusta]|uniref:histidine kinase n=1 Tax=Seminavis robusta TaxID=568900 RepID=A0A9N8E1X6_9STRA|nr:Phytochrome-like protein cph1 [Seminavis robusta]|eukprot:Sro537_g162370.1 Phytochrome-like protein cph1 (881) ;mRNA; f:38546-41897